MEDYDQISMFEQKEIVILGLIVAAIIIGRYTTDQWYNRRLL
jgi:hypothetical protein